MSIHRLPTPDDNWRSVPFRPDIDPEGKRFVTIRRDFVKPVPEGTYVAMIFRVVGYDRDVDGSAMGRYQHVNRDGEPSGWEPTHLGMYEDHDVVLDGPGDLHDLIVP